MPLTNVAVQNAKGREKPYKLADANGLYLLIQPRGSRLWRFDYRLEGKRRTLALGAYPLVTLAEARTQRDKAKRQIADGVDPSANRRLERVGTVEVSGPTFGDVAREYLERLEHDGVAEKTMQKNMWLLDRLVSPTLGSRPIASITSADVLGVLQLIEKSGRIETANRARSSIGAVFRLAVATLRADADPTVALRGAIKSPKVVNRAAFTDPRKLGWLMNAIDDYDGWPTLRAALLVTALTASRPGEVRLAEWDEFDLEAAKWTIPEARTKMRRTHEVPLSRQALDVLKHLKELTGHQQLAFSSIRTESRPLSENAMNSALRRIGVTKDEHTSHGFRSSFSTLMNERGADPDVIELCLAHQQTDKVRRAYNRARRWDDRVALMNEWADHLDELRRRPL